MLIRTLLAALALAVVATASEAGPFRRTARTYYQPSYPSYYQSYYQPVYQSPTVVEPAGATTTAPIESVIGTAAATSSVSVPVAALTQADASVGDGLDEVNAKRAAAGMRPFIRDEGLTQAARACAQFRANHGLFGHTSNDFAFVPAGSYATSAGCAAYPASYGWMSCCVYENSTYAGAAWVTGQDGRRFMHLFVR